MGDGYILCHGYSFFRFRTDGSDGEYSHFISFLQAASFADV